MVVLGGLDEDRVDIDADGRTSVPGVWAVGNATDLAAQVVISAGAGLRTGSMVNFELVEAEITALRQAQGSSAG